MGHAALSITDRCSGSNTIKIENSTFENNTNAHYEDCVTLKPVIDIRISPDYKSLSFKQCNFTGNHHSNILVNIVIQQEKECYNMQTIKFVTPIITNVSLTNCLFKKNTVRMLMNVITKLCTANFFIIGPSRFVYTMCKSSTMHNHHSVLSIHNMAVVVTGPVTMSSNDAYEMVLLKYSNQ